MEGKKHVFLQHISKSEYKNPLKGAEINVILKGHKETGSFM